MAQSQTYSNQNDERTKPTGAGTLYNPLPPPGVPAIQADALNQIMLDHGRDMGYLHMLRNHYGGKASNEALTLLMDYCHARKFDPMMKPLHIVPVWDSESRKYVEQLWPSIHQFRVVAHRTGVYSGHEVPEWGDMIELKLGEMRIYVPEWCRFTVYRADKYGEKNAFPVEVFWEEAYAKKGQSSEPNYMWAKRPKGQLLKCAESAALRAAFPEEIGADTGGLLYSAEEMEGRDINVVDISPDRPARVNAAPTDQSGKQTKRAEGVRRDAPEPKREAAPAQTTTPALQEEEPLYPDDYAPGEEPGTEMVEDHEREPQGGNRPAETTPAGRDVAGRGSPHAAVTSGRSNPPAPKKDDGGWPEP